MKEVKLLLKMVSDGLKAMAQGIEAIAEKVEDDDAAKAKSPGKAESKKQAAPVKRAKPAGKKAAPAKKAKAAVGQKKTGQPTTAIETVLDIINRSENGANTAAIKAETGYDQKKISNIIYKLKKQGQIKAIHKGVYVKS